MVTPSTSKKRSLGKKSNLLLIAAHNVLCFFFSLCVDSQSASLFSSSLFPPSSFFCCSPKGGTKKLLRSKRRRRRSEAEYCVQEARGRGNMKSQTDEGASVAAAASVAVAARGDGPSLSSLPSAAAAAGGKALSFFLSPVPSVCSQLTTPLFLSLSLLSRMPRLCRQWKENLGDGRAKGRRKGGGREGKGYWRHRRSAAKAAKAQRVGTCVHAS